MTASKTKKPIFENQNSHISHTYSQASWTLQTCISQTCISQMCTHGGVYLVDVQLVGGWVGFVILIFRKFSFVPKLPYSISLRSWEPNANFPSATHSGL